MSNTETKKPNALFEIVFNVFLPSFILMKFSGEEHLGTVMALVVALAFPVAYGGLELVRSKTEIRLNHPVTGNPIPER